MYGRTCFGNQRATFVVEEQGTVAHVIPRASVKTHDDVGPPSLGDTDTAA